MVKRVQLEEAEASRSKVRYAATPTGLLTAEEVAEHVGLSALLGHASIQMTMRYVHPAAEQKRLAIEKFEKFRAEGIISAAAARQSPRVTTKVTTVEQVN